MSVWTEKRIAMLREHFPQGAMSISSLAKMISEKTDGPPLTRAAVKMKAYKLGLVSPYTNSFEDAKENGHVGGLIRHGIKP